MNDPFDIQRIGDRSYAITFQDSKFKTVIVSIGHGSQSPINENNEFFYNLVSSVATNLFKSVKEHQDFDENIHIGNKDWNVKVIKKSDSILSLISPMIHKQGNDNIVRLEINRTDSYNPITLMIPGYNVLAYQDAIADDKAYAHSINKFNLEKSLERNVRDCEEYADMIPCTRAELNAGVRAKFSFKPYSKDNLAASFFNNPFNLSSTLAFQRYEKEFSGHDDFMAQDCRNCLIIENQELKLVLKSEILLEDKALHQQTVAQYKQLLVVEYGEEKVAYASRMCRLDLDHMISSGEPLTPEHVYRLTVTLNNIETSDIKAFLQKLPAFKNDFLDTWSVLGNEATLLNVIKGMENVHFSASELRGIIHLLRQTDEKMSPQKLMEWLEQFEGQASLELLPPESFNQLTQIFFPTPEDHLKIFTGREIYYPIRGAYTTAERGKLKPWIDQQELLQTFPVIQNTQDWDLYFEKLAFVVCKKHLFHEHPEKGYVTGALIPAPLDKNGEKRWYKVTQAVDNGYGTLCYTLDAACADSSLPQIKVFRSTSSDPYAIMGAKTVRSDINPLGLPGYEGKGRTDYYEDESLKSGTIPIWVGYTHAAKQKMANKKLRPNELQFLFNTLLIATKELHRAEASKASNLSLKEIVQKHMGIINTLYAKGLISESFLKKLQKEYLEAKQKEGVDFYESQKNDAEYFINRLLECQFELGEHDETLQIQLKTELDHLIQDLEQHLLINTVQKEKLEHLNKMHNKIFKHLDMLEEAYQEVFKKRNYKGAYELCEIWVEELEKYAKSIGEDLESKEKKDFAFAGHSLGGGLSQIYTVYHFMEKGRMPCPGHKCSTYDFDGTGVSRADNEKYKEYLSEHSEMLKNCSVNFEVYHQHEAGDPVPHIGTHLGSARDLKDAGNVLMNLTFRAAVFKRNPDAKHPTLANAQTVHATQFLEGKEGEDYKKQEIDPYMLGLMESYETMADLPKNEIQQKGKDLRETVWTFPTPLSPQTEEKIRSHPSLFKLANKMISNWIEHDPTIINHLDPYGNFCADENGLASQRIDFFPSTKPVTSQSNILQSIVEKQFESQFYPGADIKTLMKKLFRLPDDQLEAKAAEFQKKLDSQRANMIALGGEELSIRTSSGQLNAMLLSPKIFIKKLADAGVKQLTIQIGDKTSSAFLFDIEKDDQLQLSNELENLKLHEVGWSTAILAQGQIFGDAEFLNLAKRLSDIQILESKTPSFEAIKKGVIICGGNLSLYEMHHAEAASFLLRGMDVMLFNPPGYGKSKGIPNQASMTEAMIAVYDTFTKKKKLKEEDVLIKALCMSGGYASELAKHHPKMAIWIDQTYSSFASLANMMIESQTEKMMPEALSKTILALIPECCLPSFDVAQNLAHHTGWKCLMYSDRDESIPPSHVLRNLDALDDSKPTKVIQLPGQHAQTWYRLKNIENKEQQTILVKEQVDQFLLRAGFFKPIIMSEKMNQPSPIQEIEEIEDPFIEELHEEIQFLEPKITEKRMVIEEID